MQNKIIQIYFTITKHRNQTSPFRGRRYSIFFNIGKFWLKISNSLILLGFVAKFSSKIYYRELFSVKIITVCFFVEFCLKGTKCHFASYVIMIDLPPRNILIHSLFWEMKLLQHLLPQIFGCLYIQMPSVIGIYLPRPNICR